MSNIPEQYLNIHDEITGKTPEQLLQWAAAEFGAQNVALASSLSIEDQVLTDMICKSGEDIGIFTLDTGRLFPETYSTIEKTYMKYNRRIEVLFPESFDVQMMVNEKGVNLFYESVENRKLCCNVRKVLPLKKKLATLKLWITGLRREQSVTRTDVAAVEWDAANGLLKLNPLIDWSENLVREYLKQHQVPYSPLQDKGFPSIGCKPCTRAVQPGEDIRAGRWWWENPEHKECGLHRS